jgi:hypothetical protein
MAMIQRRASAWFGASESQPCVCGEMSRTEFVKASRSLSSPSPKRAASLLPLHQSLLKQSRALSTANATSLV